jgi:molecular chaperone GrpE
MSDEQQGPGEDLPEGQPGQPAGTPEEASVNDAAQAPADGAAPAAGEPTAEESAAAQAPHSREDALLDELQRLAAEYKNYRLRTEAQREIDQARARGDIAKLLFGVFDDLDRAESHDDLQEGSAFATVASKIRALGEKIGLERFGDKGEPFDPQQHEAVMQVPAPVEEQQILDVVAPGYRLGEVLLRAAKVVVAVPQDPGSAAPAGDASTK